jgi:hypothetical protein
MDETGKIEYILKRKFQNVIIFLMSIFGINIIVDLYYIRGSKNLDLFVTWAYINAIFILFIFLIPIIFYIIQIKRNYLSHTLQNFSNIVLLVILFGLLWTLSNQFVYSHFATTNRIFIEGFRVTLYFILFGFILIIIILIFQNLLIKYKHKIIYSNKGFWK